MTIEEFEWLLSINATLNSRLRTEDAAITRDILLEAFRAEKVRGDAAEEKIDQIERRRVNAEVASDRRLAVAEARIAELEARLAAAPSVPEDLRRLSEAATPGPWQDDSEKDEHGDHCAVLYANGKRVADTLNSDLAEIHTEYDEDGSYSWDDVGRSNIKFIAGAVEFVLSLIAAQAAPAQEIKS